MFDNKMVVGGHMYGKPKGSECLSAAYLWGHLKIHCFVVGERE